MYNAEPWKVLKAWRVSPRRDADVLQRAAQAKVIFFSTACMRARGFKYDILGPKYARLSENHRAVCDYESLTEDDLDCPICLEMVTEPVRLRCNHLLCRECFERLLELSSRKCPKCRRWIGGTRRISDWLDTELWEFIRKKFVGPAMAIKEQIQSDRRFALALIRQERRDRYFRRTEPYNLRRSSLNTSVSTVASSTATSEDLS